MKPITPKAHGLIDYATVAMMFVVPRLLHLNPAARAASGALAAGYLLESALTDYKPGLRRTIPFTTHGKIDLASAPAVLAVPYLAGAMTTPRSRAYFLALLGMVAGVYALTNWEADPDL